MGKKLNPSALSLRRLRLSSQIRGLVREVRLSHEQMIQPLFVVEGLKSPEAIPGLGLTQRETSESLLKRVEADLNAGISKFLLFGVPARKSSGQFDPSFTASQIVALKKRFGSDLFLAVDVCLCSYTESGQCGILSHEGDHVLNAATVSELAKAAESFAQAGADCVAPSDMMDGRVAAIRSALEEAGHERTLVMSYSAKFNSRFYGPFRVAADSAPKGALKDRASYQIDPGSPRDAFASSERDAAEGADILMVKPGLPYLDILSDLSKRIAKPWAVYEVSGEYAAVEFLAREKLIDAPRAHVESWISFARAGASMIITYGARHAREWIGKE